MSRTGLLLLQGSKMKSIKIILVLLGSIYTLSPVGKALAEASVVKGKEWLKRIDHGEELGNIIYKYYDDMNGSKLREVVQKLSDWVDT